MVKGAPPPPIFTVGWHRFWCVWLPGVKSEECLPPTPTSKKQNWWISEEKLVFPKCRDDPEWPHKLYMCSWGTLGAPQSNYAIISPRQHWNVTSAKWKSPALHHAPKGHSHGKQDGLSTGWCFWPYPVGKGCWRAAPRSRPWVRPVLTRFGCIELGKLNDSDIKPTIEPNVSWVHGH